MMGSLASMRYEILARQRKFSLRQREYRNFIVPPQFPTPVQRGRRHLVSPVLAQDNQPFNGVHHESGIVGNQDNLPRRNDSKNQTEHGLQAQQRIKAESDAETKPNQDQEYKVHRWSNNNCQQQYPHEDSQREEREERNKNPLQPDHLQVVSEKDSVTVESTKPIDNRANETTNQSSQVITLLQPSPSPEQSSESHLHSTPAITTTHALSSDKKGDLDKLTLLSRYPKNIVSQRLAGSSPFSKAHETTASSKNLNNDQQIKRLSNKLFHKRPQKYTIFNRLKESFKTFLQQFRQRRKTTAIKSERLKSENEKSATADKLSSTTRPSTSVNQNSNKTYPRASSQKSCCCAFQCCNCGRIIVIHKRRGKSTNSKQILQSIRGTGLEGDNIVPDFLQFFRGISSSLAMSSYRLFSWSVALTLATILILAFHNGLLDSVLNFRSGPLSDFYTFVGLLVTGWVLWSLGLAIKQSTFRSQTVDQMLMNSGKWAVITGCTNGIGREYAWQLAEKGMNVCLISRNAGLLMDLARDIANEFHVRTLTIQADFSKDDLSIYDDIASRLKGFDIGVLVNNVGISHTYLEPFPENASGSSIKEMIYVNMVSMAQMTKIVLPDMVFKKSGIIINLSSGFGRNPAPYMSLYGATKYFADDFSRSIAKECKDFGITVQSVTPYIVSTNMTMNYPESITTPSAKTFVRNAINTIGNTNRTHGYLPHSITGKILGTVPEFALLCYMQIFRWRANSFVVQKGKQRSVLK